MCYVYSVMEVCSSQVALFAHIHVHVVHIDYYKSSIK